VARIVVALEIAGRFDTSSVAALEFGGRAVASCASCGFAGEKVTLFERGVRGGRGTERMRVLAEEVEDSVAAA
jgi:hypothetical protein